MKNLGSERWWLNFRAEKYTPGSALAPERLLMVTITEVFLNAKVCTALKITLALFWRKWVQRCSHDWRRRARWHRHFSCRRFQPFANLRDERLHCSFAESNQINAPFEIIVAITGDVRLDHKIRALFRLRTVHILRDREALSDDIEDVLRAVLF